MAIIIQSLLFIVVTAGAIFGAAYLKGDFDPATAFAPKPEVVEEEVIEEAPPGALVTPPGFFPMEFSRPFVIPVSNGQRTTRLVIFQIKIDVRTEVTTRINSLEDRMRDRIMDTLMEMSYAGSFNNSLASPALRSEVRERVAEEAEIMLPGDVGEVLITEVLERRL